MSKNMGFVNDMITITAARDALMQYADAYEGKMPPGDRWQDAIASYYEKANVGAQAGPIKAHDIRKVIVFSSESGKRKTGLAFNKELSGKNIDTITNPNEVVMLFEVEEQVKNNSIPYKPLPYRKSPRLMGERRGWYVLTITGKDVMNNKNSPFSGSAHSNSSGTGVELKTR